MEPREKPAWLIEADVFGEGIEPLKVSIRRQGMGFGVVQPRPFLNGLVPEVGGRRLGDGDCVVFLGTYPLMRQIQLHHRWVPGGWCDAERFHCERYYPAFGRHLLNHDGLMIPIEAALSEAESLFHRFGDSGRLVIRPLGLEKTMTGRCVDIVEFVSALESARYARCGVLVARPRPVGGEWRLVVAPQGVVAASRYRQDGRPPVQAGCPEEVRSFAEQLLAASEFRPDPIFMLDICESGGSLHLLELNSFSCSGLYACDPDAVVATVAGLAAERPSRKSEASGGA